MCSCTYLRQIDSIQAKLHLQAGSFPVQEVYCCNLAVQCEGNAKCMGVSPASVGLAKSRICTLNSPVHFFSNHICSRCSIVSTGSDSRLDLMTARTFGSPRTGWYMLHVVSMHSCECARWILLEGIVPSPILLIVVATCIAYTPIDIGLSVTPGLVYGYVCAPQM